MNETTDETNESIDEEWMNLLCHDQPTNDETNEQERESYEYE